MSSRYLPRGQAGQFILLCVVVFLGLSGILGLIRLGEWVFSDSLDTRFATYSAWVKATSNTNLSFSEFEILKKRKLLPGQGQESSSIPIVFPIPIYK